MGILEIIALCGALQAPLDIVHTNGKSVTKKQCQEAHSEYKEKLTGLDISIDDRDALARIIEAEASNQGDIGQAYVLFVILNRTIHEDFANQIQKVINKKNQFEPATTAKGWRNLPAVSGEKNAKIQTMINLARSGTMPDPTGGALYFQNVKTVSKREKRGSVSKGLTGFNGSIPKETIKDHTFYTSINTSKGKAVKKPEPPNKWDVFNPTEVGKSEGSSWDVFREDDKKPWDAF